MSLVFIAFNALYEILESDEEDEFYGFKLVYWDLFSCSGAEERFDLPYSDEGVRFLSFCCVDGEGERPKLVVVGAFWV